MLKGLIASLLVLGSLGGVTGFFLYRFLTTPSPPLQHPVLVFVHKGMPLQLIAQRLGSAGMVSSARPFAWWARLTGADRQIKSGEYLFTTPLSPLALLRILTSGEGLHHTVTTTEGMTFRQISALLVVQGLGAEENFLCFRGYQPFLGAWGHP